MVEKNYQKGGGFLLAAGLAAEIFTPEDFTAEQRMIAKTTEDFVRHEVWPKLDQIEAQAEGVSKTLMLQAADLGLLMADIPQAFGGMGLDKASSALITEKMGMAGSFSVTHAAHTGIATLPIVFYGNPQQKEKYLPGLAEGKIGAYCLTEPGSGSDALAAKTSATLSEDGKYYRLNGTKQFITNAKWAETFIVFAKVEGRKFSAFIVERGMPGVAIAPEELKLGIKGSSTAALILDEVKVPVENLLGEVGKGHLIAFNILNIGRYKLGAGVIGAAKLALEYAVKYAVERKQFKQSLSEFGLIRKKIALMASRIYVAESLVYRTVGLIDNILEGVKDSAAESSQQILKGIEEYAIECSMAKVYGSEMVDYVVDESLQIFGGYGYSQEYPIERLYRDARINRIFEGTSEINRLLIPGMLLRRALQGDLPLLRILENLKEEVEENFYQTETSGLTVGQPGWYREKLENARKAVLMTAGLTVEKHLKDLSEQQELLALLADMIMEYYALESALLRWEKGVFAESDWRSQALLTYFPAAMARLRGWGREVLGAVLAPAQLAHKLTAFEYFLELTPFDTIRVRDLLAENVFSGRGYPHL
ncbi:MAG: acyl-CoA dehydrogenase family protein [Deltaproteobacteria bacterium]|nr:acyl-CoA dehydrogenase family protein [Deltaproteobacteria bacterium]